VKNYSIADIHCHPNLKTFGHSFSYVKKNKYNKTHLWFYDPPNVVTKLLNTVTGLTKFRQTDFSTMAKGNVRLAFVSFYPFEKGFFHSAAINPKVAATLANFVTGIGYSRVRHLQKHTDYYQDLYDEYTFFQNSCKEFMVDGRAFFWEFPGSGNDVERILNSENGIAVIPTIEGAHVLNTGLHPYGREADEETILQHINSLKTWDFPPFFITFAHNFNNEMCGHARSLERLGKMVDQNQNLDGDFSQLGIRVLHTLLSRQNGRPIFIDIKHMSLRARLTFYDIIESEYNNEIPVIVSHGAVTGTGLSGSGSGNSDCTFCGDDINFFDEELIKVVETGGVFGLQMDSNRLAQAAKVKSSLRHLFSPYSFLDSVRIIWLQLQHFAEVLDRQQLFGWGNMTIGSDFDGTINPLNGIWTAENYQAMAEQLVVQADAYLKSSNPLRLSENKNISAEEIVERFVYRNAVDFVKRYY
jgi:hypothetical protein